MAFAFLFFDSVGGGEWLVLLAVVLIVVGPKNLPSAARKTGQILAQLRRAADEFKRQIMTMDQEMEKAVSAVKQDYVDVVQDVEQTVTAEGAAESPVAPAGHEAPGAMDDGYDRAYDYYGDDTYAGYTSETGPEEPASAAESPAETPAPAPAPDPRAITIAVTTAADREGRA